MDMEDTCAEASEKCPIPASRLEFIDPVRGKQRAVIDEVISTTHKGKLPGEENRLTDQTKPKEDFCQNQYLIKKQA